MSSKRVYYGMIGLIILLCVGLVGSAFGINNMLNGRTKTLTSLKARSQALDQEQTGFSTAQQNVKKYASLEQIANTVVPQDKSQAQAVRQLVNIAAANGVTLGSITFPVSTLGSSAAGATTNSNTTTTPSSSATSTSANAAASSATNKLSQLTPVVGIPGVYQLTITVNSNGSVAYNQLISFLNDLEHDRRTAQVNSIAIQPDKKDPNSLGFTLTLNEYIKP